VQFKDIYIGEHEPREARSAISALLFIESSPLLVG
jgi:hypothetical protein